MGNFLNTKKAQFSKTNKKAKIKIDLYHLKKLIINLKKSSRTDLKSVKKSPKKSHKKSNLIRNQ